MRPEQICGPRKNRRPSSNLPLQKSPVPTPRRHFLVDVGTGNKLPPMPGTPVLSSAAAPWEGLLLEQHAGGEVDMADVAAPQHTIILHLAQHSRVELRQNGAEYSKLDLAAGQLTINPAMVPFSIRTKNSGPILAVTLEPSFVQVAANEIVSPDQLQIAPQPALNDDFIRSTLLCLRNEVEAGAPAGRA